MDYRVEELAARAGLSVDTVRFYQGRGLLPPPRREGRVALYGDAHLQRLRRLRSLLDEGFTLALAGRLFATEEAGEAGEAGEGALLEALVEERVGPRRLTRSELAHEAGVPEALVVAAESAGLVTPVADEADPGGEPRFGEADVQMARSALSLLAAGFPLQELLGLATEHAAEIQQLCDRAIDLFDDHLRKRRDTEAVTRAFRELLPEATRLVALHFQRTLVSRALERLAESGDDELRDALTSSGSARLEVAWR